jgi:hypothetical protein
MNQLQCCALPSRKYEEPNFGRITCTLPCYPTPFNKVISTVTTNGNNETKNDTNLYNKTVHALNAKYNFDIMPDILAVRNAGYNDTKINQCSILYGPAADDNYLYYVTGYGEAVDSDHLASFLIKRLKKDGTLVYAINCSSYSLDTSLNMFGDKIITSHSFPTILGGTLYITTNNISNIGPQIFAINKHNGNLKWALAFYPPNNLDPIYTRDNYEQYRGSNLRISNMNPTAVCSIGHKYIYVGSSSLQQIISGNYYDQSFLFEIEDMDTYGVVKYSTPTCAPPLKIGDTIIKSNNDVNLYKYDPFKPTENSVVIETISVNGLIAPYYILVPLAPGTPNSSPILTKVEFDNTTIITPAIVQPVWNVLPQQIYQDNDSINSFTLAQLIVLWQIEQGTLPPSTSVTHYIWSYLTSAQMTAAQLQVGNNGITYYKILYPGHLIDNIYDANGLNYYGNGLNGAAVSIDNDSIYFGTNSAYKIPFDEQLYYFDGTRNYRTIKTPYIDGVIDYMAGIMSLDNLNILRETFMTKLKTLCLNTPRSPRGQMSYTDSIICINKNNGTIKYAYRTIESDVVSNIPSLTNFLFPIKGIEGGLTSGIHITNNYVCANNKAGLLTIINKSGYNSVTFNHYNFNDLGITIPYILMLGTGSIEGGSNLQDALYSKCGAIVSMQLNQSWKGGCTSSFGIYETYVDYKGNIMAKNYSYVTRVDIATGIIKWIKNIFNTGGAQIALCNNITFATTQSGILLALDTENGYTLWKIDGTTLSMGGGPNAPTVIGNKIYWINTYQNNTYGTKGVCFKVDCNLIISRLNTGCFDICKYTHCYLMCKNFINYDTYPKSVNDTNKLYNCTRASNLWYKQCGKTQIIAQHLDCQYREYNATYTVASVCGNKMIIEKLTDPTQMVYLYIEIISTTTYLVAYKFPDNIITQYVWMKLQLD